MSLFKKILPLFLLVPVFFLGTLAKNEGSTRWTIQTLIEARQAFAAEKDLTETGPSLLSQKNPTSSKQTDSLALQTAFSFATQNPGSPMFLTSIDEPELPEMYEIKIKNVLHGSITTDLKEASEGALVNITTKPELGFQAVRITISDGKTETEAVKGEKGWTFVMPASDVTIFSVFERSDTKLRTITLEAQEGGEIVLSHETAMVYESVVINVTPHRGFALDAITVTDSNGKNVKVTKTARSHVFVMPSRNVTVSVTFAEVPPEDREIFLTPVEYGTVTADCRYALPGADVKLSLQPDEGYRIKTIQILAGETEVSAQEQTPNTYTFSMPEEDVTISVAFEKIPEPSHGQTPVPSQGQPVDSDSQEHPPKFPLPLFLILGCTGLIAIVGLMVYLKHKDRDDEEE